ncbi:hypothetical protein D3C73_1580440 [compost metagenome]
MTSPPPSLYDKAPIIQGFVVPAVWKNLPAHTSAHTLDKVLLLDGRMDCQWPIAFTQISEKRARR